MFWPLIHCCLACTDFRGRQGIVKWRGMAREFFSDALIKYSAQNLRLLDKSAEKSKVAHFRPYIGLQLVELYLDNAI